MKILSYTKVILLITFLTIGLTGCAAKYTHSTKSPRDFERDQRDCQAMAEKSAAKKGIPVCEETRNCLEIQKGWRRVLW
jgi:hypothetical protein